MKMLLIHAPIPFVILLRKFVFGLRGDETWQKVLIITVSVIVCIIGQLVGGRVIPRILAKRRAQREGATSPPMETVSEEKA